MTTPMAVMKSIVENGGPVKIWPGYYDRKTDVRWDSEPIFCDGIRLSDEYAFLSGQSAFKYASLDKPEPPQEAME